MELSNSEKELAREIGFDQLICELVKQITGGKIQHLLATVKDEDQEYEETNGFSVVIQRENVEQIINTLQTELIPRGYWAFWSDCYHSEIDKETDEIAVLKTTDSYEIIRLRQSNGANYNLFADEIIAKLKEWENLCELFVYGAAYDWVAIELRTLPKDICSFAEDVYEFCPDSVEQGIGLMEESDDPEFFEAARKLCPELSPQMQAKLTMEEAQFAGMNMPEEFRQFQDSDNEGATSTAMGIKLLAYSIKQSKSLFLWWD